jgi:hypothetical protein
LAILGVEPDSRKYRKPAFFIEVDLLAINHWQLRIDTHTRFVPDNPSKCAEIAEYASGKPVYDPGEVY